ncbi:hypothetical protein K2W90_05150 [Candidatus Babeliales bacterium]|nr:hypothetical protein [Candidatus Babeliales bacterium]
MIFSKFLGLKKKASVFLRDYQEQKYKRNQIANLYKSSLAIPVTQKADRVLFWVTGGMSLLLNIEGAVALALRLRGVNVHLVICDGTLPACVRREVVQDYQCSKKEKRCSNCKQSCAAVLDSLGLPYSFVGDFITHDDRAFLFRQAQAVTWETVGTLVYEGVNIGKNILSALIRYSRGHDIKERTDVLLDYTYAGLLVAAASRAAIKQYQPKQLFMSHGTYVDWGPALHNALSQNIPVTAWMSSYMPYQFYFKQITSEPIDFYSISTQAWQQRKSVPLIEVEKKRLDQFLSNRYKKQISFDMKSFGVYQDDIQVLKEHYKIDPNKPVWGIFCHINWDNVGDYVPMPYENFNEWIFDTIVQISSIEDVTWLIKIHPAEVWENPQSGLEQFINKNFPLLPKHIKIISMHDEISPLNFYQLIDGAVTVCGTAGLEILLMGKPVILVGQAHYGQKGFTYDSFNKKDYHDFLRRVVHMPLLTDYERNLACQYAYCFFLQRQIPFDIVEHSKNRYFRFDQVDMLLPGNNDFIDFICDGIMAGRDFVMSDTLVEKWCKLFE